MTLIAIVTNILVMNGLVASGSVGSVNDYNIANECSDVWDTRCRTCEQ